MIYLSVILTLLCFTSPLLAMEAAPSKTHEAEFIDTTGQKLGAAHLIQGPNGTILQISLKHLPVGSLALHLHESSTCDIPGFLSVGQHYNPTGKKHGFLNPEGPHMGDLPNVLVNIDGSASQEFFLSQIYLDIGSHKLLDGDGSALILHKHADDHMSDPSGHSGERIACASLTNK